MYEPIIENVIKTVVPEYLLTADTVYHINPSGSFLKGGPAADAGTTGRKIIIDTYGGWGAHGGGAFSGKDPSKVDRSGAYAGRWIAKSLVANKLCERCLVQVSYAIGLAKPLSVHIETYGTALKGKKDYDLLQIVLRNFDLRAGMISKELELKRPIFKQLAAYGHFGREEIADAKWEVPKDLSHEF